VVSSRPHAAFEITAGTIQDDRRALAATAVVLLDSPPFARSLTSLLR
jgi:hypothetical protein